MELANNLKKHRFDKNNLTQEDLAKAVGVSRQTIISLERERFVPSTLLALRLAAFFQTDVESIFYLKK